MSRTTLTRATLRRTGGSRRGSWTLGAILLLAGLSVACRPDRPLVERSRQGQWRPESFQVVSMGGQRSGARVEFTLRLDGRSGRRLTVEGNVEIDPQARLTGGRWSERDGSTEVTGELGSAAVDFFGGQGDRPSLGGQFTLSRQGVEVYRINLPTTRLTAER